MRCVLIAVGHRMPAWIAAGFDEYARRMPRESLLRLVEIKPEARGDAGPGAVRRLLEAEGRRIRAALPAQCLCIVLDEHGTQLTTQALAERMTGWRMAGRDVAFVVGGADGLDPQVKDDADMRWSLSRLTLPHGLVRVLVAEQLYRAASILQGHPYHRA